MPSAQPIRLLTAREVVSKRTQPRLALLVMQNLRLSRVVSRVLKALGMDAMTLANLDEDDDWLERHNPDLLIYDIDSETLQTKAILHYVSQQESPPALILLSEGGDVPMLKDLAGYPSGYNLVLKNGHIDNGDLMVTARKLVNRDIFGIDKYLRWGSIIQSCTVEASSEKNEMVARLEQLLADLQCDSRYITDLANVMDEFITNAFFHGPNENGIEIHANTPRNQVITLPAWRRPTIEFGSDGRLVAVACRDPFGSLDTTRLLAHLAACNEAGLAQVSTGPGGAGVGLYLTYRSVDHLVINVEEGVATEFVGIVDISLTYREHMSLKKRLNVFTLDPFAD